MKKHIPNFITCLNVLTGTLGITMVLVNRDPSWALIFVVVATVFDFLDGLIARALKLQSEFGKQLDSLADLISFGVLPAFALLIFIESVHSNEIFDLRIFSPVSYFGLLIVPFSALRLARFNLAANQSDEFRGLPTPANALMIATITFVQPGFVTVGVLLAITVLSCFLLISNIPMIALKFKTIGWSGNELRYSLIILEIIGLVTFHVSFISFIIPMYIAISAVGQLLSPADIS